MYKKMYLIWFLVIFNRFKVHPNVTNFPIKNAIFEDLRIMSRIFVVVVDKDGHWEQFEEECHLKGATKLCFSHYLCVLNTGWPTYPFSTDYFGKLVFLFSCFMWFLVVSFEFDVKFKEPHHLLYTIIVYISAMWPSAILFSLDNNFQFAKTV